MNKFFSNDYLVNQKLYVKKCNDILKDGYKLNKPLFFVHSYGCQGNVSEGEKIEGILNEIGYEKCCDEKIADVVILNTCAIREKAQDKVFSALGNILNHKKLQKNKIVAICGCMVQQKHIIEKIEKKFPSVDLVFGPHVIHKLPEFLYNLLSKTNKKLIDITDKEVVEEEIPIFRNNKIKALVPISYGCNNFCSYCIVPYVKGRERSRDFKTILKEVKILIEKGYKEITLLGQNVNSYGLDLNIKDGFLNLLYEINKLDGKFKIRFMTSHPKDFTKELIDMIAQCDKVCKHFHLPVQSGCDKILKAMNRKYCIKDYLKIVEYAKEKIKNCTLTTDIIVGFPGETYEDFKQTMNLIKRVEYIYIFNFIFSKRVGTRAEKMQDLVSKKEKVKWLQELIDLQNEISYMKNKTYENEIEEVLFEDLSKTDDGLMVGKTDGNILVCCEKDESKLYDFAKVKIEKASRTMLKAKII